LQTGETAGAAVGQGRSETVEGNGKIYKTKKSLPNIFVSVHQQC